MPKRKDAETTSPALELASPDQMQELGRTMEATRVTLDELRAAAAQEGVGEYDMATLSRARRGFTRLRRGEVEQLVRICLRLQQDRMQELAASE